MYYSLIPPVLIVLSIIGIIVFLVKKSSRVNEIVEEDLSINEDDISEKGFLGKIKYKIKSIRGEDIKHFFLGIIERIVRKSRIIFLKLESKFGEISNNIRSKRQNKMMRKSNDERKAEDKANNIFRKLGRNRYESLENKKAPLEIKKLYEEDEKEVKPMLSEKITVPEPREEMKDKLEEILIERIAVNPRDIEAYERLGEYYVDIKNYDDAKECFKQVIKLNPGNRNVKYKIRRLEYLLSK